MQPPAISTAAGREDDQHPAQSLSDGYQFPPVGQQPPSPGRAPLEPSAALRDRRALLLMSIRETGERAPLAQEIFDSIAIDIVEGRLRPGESLNSVDLAQR